MLYTPDHLSFNDNLSSILARHIITNYFLNLDYSDILFTDMSRFTLQSSNASLVIL